MFDVLQLLHNFLLSSVVHVRYLVAQKFFQPNSRTREIPNLYDTRWICYHEATEVVLCTLPAIMSAIDDFAEEVGNRGNNAWVLLSQITPCFIIHLSLMRFVLNICNLANVKLQLKSETHSEALQCIKAMKNFTDRPLYPNNDTVWDNVYDEAEKIIASCELSDIRRDRAVPFLPEVPIQVKMTTA
ncbi:Zmym1 [Oopsacas minuta]|uniref:Zmym1 n=1 Tax=Oopsacas minuta TaxID=111878 RepID=A0AAV7JHL4_9METZ|nr:Zmym1 [Oopsacas minuta]